MKVAVKQTENQPIPAEIIAASIVRIASGIEKVNQSGLNQKALILLVSHASGVTQAQVRKVLNGLSSLQEQYLTKPRQKK